MVSFAALVGAGVVAVGLLIALVGLVFLAGALSRTRSNLQGLKQRVQAAGAIGELADLVKELIVLIQTVGVDTGVPLVMIIVSIVFVALGSALIGVSGP